MHGTQDHLGVERPKPLGCDLDLRPPDGALVEQRLARQVRQLDVVAVGEDDGADAGGWPYLCFGATTSDSASASPALTGFLIRLRLSSFSLASSTGAGAPIITSCAR